MIRRGFTLIELLAVIVLLAIIALIAVPIVINIINDAKDESGIRSVDLYIDAVEKAIVKQNFKTKYDPDECIIQESSKLKCSKDLEEYPEELEIEMNGDKATNGTIEIENGKIVKIKYLTLGDNHYRYDEGKVYKTQAPPKEAGLYDDNYNLLASWDDLVDIYHLNINSNYTGTYNDGTSGSMYNILNNNDELKNGTILIVKDGIMNIGASVFQDCTSLKEIKLPQIIQSIGQCAFYNCINLASINIPENIIRLEPWLFWNCKSLKFIKMPDSVTYIGYQAFCSCSNLKKIVLSSSLKYIEDGAFMNDINLINITIPQDVIRIKNHAFFGCSHLNFIAFENTTGWYITNQQNIGHTDIDVTNPQKNVINFKNNYNKYWKRDE